MTPEQLADLVRKANAVDRRVTATEDDLRAWNRLVGQLDYAAAVEALERHYRASTDRVMPAHIRGLVNGAPAPGRPASGYICGTCHGVHGSDPCSVLVPRPSWHRDAVARAAAETRRRWNDRKDSNR